MTKKHISLRVTGNVQGVYFRASAVEQARRLGITGLVRNEPDGSVYIEAEGTEDALSTFTEWCRQGPPRARVLDVKITEGPVMHYKTFDIVRA